MSSATASATGSRLQSAGSFLKWAGGKGRLAPALMELVPESFGRYWELFLGGGAMFFALQPAEATLVDLNPDLVAAFVAVRDRPEDLMRELDTFENTREFFEAVRRSTPPTDVVARGARTIYLNKTCFRGLWRVNRQGQFNTPYGAYQRPYYNREQILNASAALRDAEVLCSDYRALVDRARPGDFVFCDPPYDPAGGYSDFKRYTPGQFGESDHAELAEAVAALARRGVMVMVTNADTPLINALYSRYRRVRVESRRDINLKSHLRGSVDLVITTY